MDEKMKRVLQDILENLTDAQKEKAKACKSNDELMDLLGEWDIELPDDVMENISGGCDWHKLARRALEQGEVL